MGTENIYQAVMRVVAAHAKHVTIKTHLDIGPGKGRLITLFKEPFGTETRACDYPAELLNTPGQELEIVNLNSERLPYADNSFDVVTATEVVEHPECSRGVLRDIHRVVKPGHLSLNASKRLFRGLYGSLTLLRLYGRWPGR